MRQLQHHLPFSCLVIILGLFPTQLMAGGMGYRSDLNIPIVLQGTSEIRGLPYRGPRLLIRPNRAAYDPNVPPGIRLIVIIDANQPNRILFRQRVSFAGQNIFYRIRANPRPRPGNEIILVPIQPPVQGTSGLN
ncbi:MAG: hypothetical protein ACFCD0_05695 [Gemmataceae bacterium]